jgi:CRISPR/Cas system-associated exonuclease Cas4 (RecB family)
MKFYNDSEKISASEINKYTYCPLSFYYERRYGRRHIRKLYLKRLEELNLMDETGQNFIKGQKFHNEDFGSTWALKRVAKIALTIIIALAFFALIYYAGPVR